MAQAAVPLASLPQIQAPFFQLPSPPSPYRKLKEMDELLDSVHESLSGARQLYQRTLKDFAVLCHDLWQQEKAQGNREGKGFRKGLRDAGIKVGRAYQAMKKFFPSDFSTKRKSLTKKKFSTLFTVNKVGSTAEPASQLDQADVSEANQLGPRFIGKLPEGKEALQCIFALTPEEKAEFTEFIEGADNAQLQQLFLQTLRQAAQCPLSPLCPPSPPTANQNQVFQGLAAGSQKLEAKKSEIINNDAVCNGMPLADALPVPVPNPQKSEIKNQKSEIPKGLAASSQKLEARKSEIASNDAVCNGIAPAPNPQKPEIKNQKSEILQDAFLQLDSAFPNLLSQVTGSPLAPKITPSRQMLRFQKRKQEKKQRRMERFLDQLLGNGR